MDNLDRIGLGGSCHWCTEAIFQSLKGVLKVEQGWISAIKEPSFSEAIIVHYDQTIISLETIIEIHLHTHSCTSNHSMRKKYRSAIYYFSKKQADQSTKIIDTLKLDFDKPILTQVLEFSTFKLNSENYLDYYYKNPEKPFCQNVINPKLRILMDKFRDKVADNKQMKT